MIFPLLPKQNALYSHILARKQSREDWLGPSNRAGPPSRVEREIEKIFFNFGFGKNIIKT